eukprot:TRINITY_DN33379_c0_g1_i1.p1 TRINITY_DN33379_c0_g1~~TRINITY_DN33379_c0_g1_i1.p1  ORF type:complete len:670 (-),score=140.12 TRINITY_DN33379_c0_g1_i1:270-2279(-)
MVGRSSTHSVVSFDYGQEEEEPERDIPKQPSNSSLGVGSDIVRDDVDRAEDNFASRITTARASFWKTDVQDDDGNGPKAARVQGTFADPDAMKAEVRANLAKGQPKAVDIYKVEGFWALVARHSVFNNLSLAAVAANAMWMCVDTDHNDSELLLAADPIFIVVENIFCIVFFVEWVFRFMALSNKVDAVKNMAVFFDTMLVAFMVLETWIVTAVVGIFTDGSASMGDTSFMRLARLIRLSRMARMVRLLRAIPELMILIKGMAAAMRSVLLTLVMLAILTYVFSIFFVQLLGGTDCGQNYFSQVSHGMYSLMIHGTLLEDVKKISNDIAAENLLYAVVFYVYILLAAFTIVNMLIGVLCEVVSMVAATEREQIMVSYVVNKVREMVDELDDDRDGTISKDEIQRILMNPKACRALQDVGVDVLGLVDNVDSLFVDKSGKEKQGLQFPEFIEVVLQLRGSNSATVKDIIGLGKVVRLCANEVLKEIADISAQLKMGSPKTLSCRVGPLATTRQTVAGTPWKTKTLTTTIPSDDTIKDDAVKEIPSPEGVWEALPLLKDGSCTNQFNKMAANGVSPGKHRSTIGVTALSKTIGPPPGLADCRAPPLVDAPHLPAAKDPPGCAERFSAPAPMHRSRLFRERASDPGQRQACWSATTDPQDFSDEDSPRALGP